MVLPGSFFLGEKTVRVHVCMHVYVCMCVRACVYMCVHVFGKEVNGKKENAKLQDM